nr:MAG TPA: hypothetical protein [Caudoviricetes sp.]
MQDGFRFLSVLTTLHADVSARRTQVAGPIFRSLHTPSDNRPGQNFTCLFPMTAARTPLSVSRRYYRRHMFHFLKK